MAIALVLASSLLASTPGFAAGPRPSAPRFVHAVAGVGSVVVSFERPLSQGSSPIRDFVIKVIPQFRLVSCHQTRCLIRNLRADTTYLFSVAATNRSGRGAFSVESNRVVPLRASTSTSTSTTTTTTTTSTTTTTTPQSPFFVTTNVTSASWAGYVDVPPPASSPLATPFTAVSASWVVPKVTCTPGVDSHALEWVGIDGYGGVTVEQDGTNTSCSNGVPTYGAFYEMWGVPSVNNGFWISINDPVQAGDVVTSSVSESNHVWSFNVVDATQHWTFTTVVPDPNPVPQQSSAEFIVETPQICPNSNPSTCTTTTLSNFASVTFTNIAVASAGVSSPEGVAGVPNFGVSLTQGTATLAAPGPLGPSGTSFSVTYSGP